MMMENYLAAMALIILTAALLLLFALRYDPQRPHARWLRRAVTGVLLLALWNALPLPHLGMNPLSVLAAGALGLPGVGLMAVVNMLP